MRYLLDADYFVYFWRLPLSIHGMVSTNDDGTYTIIINDRISEANQLIAYIHEVRHIQNDDFYNGLPIKKVEGL